MKAIKRAFTFLLMGLSTVVAGAATSVDVSALAAKVTSNIVTKISARVSENSSSVRALASTNNYALLKSTKLKDAAAKFALQKELAEAALADEESSESGRRKWHGQYVSAKVDLEAATATFIYADGTEYTVAFQKPNLVAQVAAANAKLPVSMTNGVPKALAEARARRFEEKHSTVRTVVETVTATKGTRPE